MLIVQTQFLPVTVLASYIGVQMNVINHFLTNRLAILFLFPSHNLTFIVTIRWCIHTHVHLLIFIQVCYWQDLSYQMKKHEDIYQTEKRLNDVFYSWNSNKKFKLHIFSKLNVINAVAWLSCSHIISNKKTMFICHKGLWITNAVSETIPLSKYNPTVSLYIYIYAYIYIPIYI